MASRHAFDSKVQADVVTRLAVRRRGLLHMCNLVSRQRKQVRAMTGHVVKVHVYREWSATAFGQDLPDHDHSISAFPINVDRLLRAAAGRDDFVTPSIMVTRGDPSKQFSKSMEFRTPIELPSSVGEEAIRGRRRGSVRVRGKAAERRSGASLGIAIRPLMPVVMSSALSGAWRLAMRRDARTDPGYFLPRRP